MISVNLNSVSNAGEITQLSKAGKSSKTTQSEAVVKGNGQTKTDSVKISDSAQKQIKIPEAVDFSDIDFDQNPEAINFLKQEYPNLQVSKNKNGKTKISFSNNKYEYTICNNETLVKNKQTGQMQLFNKCTIRSDYGLHVVNYNSKGIPESYQRFDIDGKNGDEIEVFDPEEIAKGLKPTLNGIFGMQLTDEPEYLGQNVDM